MNQVEFFDKFGYAYLKNLLTPEECVRFASILLTMKDENMLHYEGKTPEMPHAFYDNSFGGNHAEFEAALRTVQPRVEQELGLVGRIKPANSFGRIYYNGGTLSVHTDREGLDYTVSITLFNNLDTDWPLWVIDKQRNTIPLNIGMGDGGIMLGTRMSHWRDPLVCEPHQYVVQMFMHWTEI